ncbi:DUF2147 domain-containing protein [Bradyrhizobium sp. WSM2254]|uniref:DUF2147 domain-containing protein n=1 Tax=Bradyrhizobium sp. WSM2254 TaxID=1188263 RepID=UPI0004030747|nr:DUF2147 domain-containing protein [Bradyrhizobium sp. WSM2254]
MNKLTIAATALFLASTAAAHAGNSISFQIEGQHIRIETPRNCASLDCVTIVAPGLSDKPIKLNNINLKGLGSKDDDVDTTPAPATTAQPAPTPVQQQPVQQAPVQATAPAAPAVAAPAAPATTVAAAPSVGFDNTVQPAPAAALVAAPAPAPAPVAAAPAQVANTPIGIWATEENKGNVRVEQCGANLCGYAQKTNERILINMKPEGSKWSGRIHDPDSGRNYDSTIAMKGPNAMRVQGCAFGGMFCGGQTWKRVG